MTAMGTPPSQFEGELGATAPLGYWDPLGLSKNATPEKFARWRATELKHGRIAMAATTGYIAQECFRWPGFLSTSAGVKFADLPNGIGAWAGMPDAGKAQVVFGILLMEAFTWKYYDGNGPWWAPGRKVPEGKEPGDVAGEVWVRYTDPEVRAQKLNIELNNGRAAMLGITGMLMHDHITGSWIPPGF
jgi:light-harvesting complex I chlorophyll a/b binding protein 1